MMEKLEKALQKLKTTGVRMTPQRHAILAYLLNTMNHPTADEIYKAIADNFPNMSVATVYNNLRLFRESGLVRELTYGDTSSRFDANITEHYHVICSECNKMVDFEYPDLQAVEQIAFKRTGFQIDSHRMEIYGRCEECQKKLVN